MEGPLIAVARQPDPVLVTTSDESELIAQSGRAGTYDERQRGKIISGRHRKNKGHGLE